MAQRNGNLLVGITCCVAALICLATATKAETLSEQTLDRSSSGTQRPGHSKESHCQNQFRIALDVGHTPELFGTLTARGRTEYEFNLKLAEAVRDALIARGYKNVFLIEMRGGLDTLPQRDIEANDLKANLFISLHHDAVQPSYLKTWIVNGKQQQYNDDYSGYSLFVSEKNQKWQDSLAFATALSDQLLARGMHFTLHHVQQDGRELLDKDRGIYRYDDLIVLKHFDGPAVLLEAAVVVNRDEELIADSSERHALIADAMFHAIDEFCESQDAGANSAR